MVGDESFPNSLCSHSDLASGKNLNMEVEIKETFESFIGLIPTVSAEYQMLKLVVLPSPT